MGGKSSWFPGALSRSGESWNVGIRIYIFGSNSTCKFCGLAKLFTFSIPVFVFYPGCRIEIIKTPFLLCSQAYNALLKVKVTFIFWSLWMVQECLDPVPKSQHICHESGHSFRRVLILVMPCSYLLHLHLLAASLGSRGGHVTYLKVMDLEILLPPWAIRPLSVYSETIYLSIHLSIYLRWLLYSIIFQYELLGNCIKEFEWKGIHIQYIEVDSKLFILQLNVFNLPT